MEIWYIKQKAYTVLPVIYIILRSLLKDLGKNQNCEPLEEKEMLVEGRQVSAEMYCTEPLK